MLSSALLNTRLVPPPTRARLIARGQLVERLLQGLQQRLLLLIAPVGFGKTTLLSASLPLVSDRSVAWLSLDERDNDPTRFWGYLIAALDRIAPGAGDHALSMVRSPTPAPLEVVLGALFEELERQPASLTLVLDDYHVISEPSIHAGLRQIIEMAPACLHLVISSRSEPPLPLARLRVQGELVELGSHDLRFSEAEVAEFLAEVLDRPLSRGAIATLAQRTEGWPAALALAALSLRDQQNPQTFIESFTGDHRHLVDYLADEVLQRQPPAIREFLLATSILDRLSGELCEALFAPPEALDAPAVQTLEDLERGGLFLQPLDDSRRWYRYHALFRDFLRARLRRDEPTREAVLHQRAAAWFAAHRMPVEAVEHLLAAGDPNAAVVLIERFARPLLLRSEVTTVLGWLQALPPQMLHERPPLHVLMAWALAVAGRFEAVEPHLAARQWYAETKRYLTKSIIPFFKLTSICKTPLTNLQIDI